VTTRLSPPPLVLIAPVVLLVFGAQLELWTRLPGSKALLVATALAYTLPLLAARTYPLPAFAIAILAIDVEAVFAREATRQAGAPLFAGLAAAFLVALLASRREAIAGLAWGFVAVLLVARDSGGLAHDVVSFLFTGALLVVAWGVGFAVRERHQRVDVAEERAARAEREHEVAARIAVADERARIARELHDIVAHSVSVMVLRAGAVRHKLPPGFAEGERGLRDVEQAGRDALAEMRQLLGALRTDDDIAELAPQAGVANLAALAEGITQAGLPAEIHVEGEPVSLPPGIDRTAYRIAQEGLTNALKHACAHHATVRLSYAPHELGIEISDDGAGPQPSDGDGLGHGLIGIRERVKIYGGQMETLPGPAGGFLLRAHLPLRPAPK
jgi:signal transduction histidine kinase